MLLHQTPDSTRLMNDPNILTCIMGKSDSLHVIKSY